MTTNTYAEPALYRENLPPQGITGSGPAPAKAALEFGRFRVLLRQRKLVADGVPLELGSRAFDLLLVLLEADGALVTKDELMSTVWPGIVVAEENLKTQIFALRRALGEDRDFIRTEFGRGYRFTAAVRSIVAGLSALDANGSPVKSKVGSPTDFLPIAARLVCCEITPAGALIRLSLRAPYLPRREWRSHADLRRPAR
jgi:DNA-binding winged helix-turn-helix (wHTH) protein